MRISHRPCSQQCQHRPIQHTRPAPHRTSEHENSSLHTRYSPAVEATPMRNTTVSLKLLSSMPRGTLGGWMSSRIGGPWGALHMANLRLSALSLCMIHHRHR